MANVWAELRFAASANVAALVATSVHVVEAYARSRVEQARAELRQGDLSTGFDTLQALIDSLYSDIGTAQQSAGLELVLAIAQSVAGQGLEQAGDTDGAVLRFRESVNQFSRLDMSLLNARDHSDLGVALAATGDEEAGYERLLHSRQAGGATPEAARRQALILLALDRVDEAEDLLRETLLTLPSDPEALRSLGTILADRGDPEASAYLATAVYALLTRGRFDEAIDAIERLEHLSGHSKLLAGVHADALRLGDRADESLEFYETALSAEPGNAWLLFGRAASLLVLGQLEDASDSAEVALSASPDDPGLLTLAARIALASERLSEAAQHALRAVAEAPRWTEAHSVLAEAFARAGDLAQALDAIRAARLLAPSDGVLLAWHGMLEIEAGSLSTATEIYRQICATPESTEHDYSRLVRLLDETGQHDAALTAGRAALERFGEVAPVLLALGHVATTSEGQLDYLRRAAAAPDHEVEATLELAHALVGSGELDAALELADTAAREDPGAAGAYEVSGEVYALRGQWTQALSAARHALDLDPSSTRALVVLGVGALADNDNAGAERWLRKALRVDPQHDLAQIYLAEALTDSRPDDARTILDELIDAGTDLAEAFYARGRLFFIQSEFDAAISDLRHAVDLHPEDSPTQAMLADALRAAGDAEQSLLHAATAVDLDPGSPQALVARASAYIALDRRGLARADLNAAIALRPDYSAAHVMLAQLADSTAAAQRHLEDARRVSSDPRDIDIEQASLYLREHRYGDAVHQYESLLAQVREPRLVAAHLDALRLAGRIDEAMQSGEVALSEMRNDPLVQRAYAVLLVETGRASDGIAMLETLTKEVGDADSWGDLGWALTADGRVEDALTAFDRSLVLAPDDAWTLDRTAQILLDIGQFGPGRMLAERALDANDESVDALLKVGWASQYEDEPDYARGFAAFDKAWSLHDVDDPDPWTLSGRADCKKGLGDPTARDDYAQALKLAKRDVAKGKWMLSTAGWCMFRLGDLAGAARMFLDAVSLGDEPGSDEFDLALVTLCHGRSERAQKLYHNALQAIAVRRPLIQRGLLAVAIQDIRVAQSDYRLEGTPVADQALAELHATLRHLPEPPELKSLSH